MNTARINSRFSVACLLAALSGDVSFAQPFPSITQQPQSQSALAGTNAFFTVTATGQLPLTYEWSFNGSNLSNSFHIGGATNTTLIISNITSADVGDYQVSVSNHKGTTNSSVATLKVLLPPSITSQPADAAVVLSSNASFAVTAAGTEPLNPQWFFKGAPLADGGRITGSATTNLNIANVQTNDAGAYQLLVTNAYGAATSAVATLAVLLPPSILTSPTNQRILVGGSASFGVTAAGTQPLSYQWQKDGVALTDGGSIWGTTNSTLTISNLQFSDDGAYGVVVTNAYGVATSAPAILSVATNLPPLSGSVGVWGDYDNDGLMDVLLAGTIQGVTNIPDGRFTRLYHNAGAGIFDDAGVVLPQLDNASAAWGDCDNDGHPDLLLSGLADGTNGPVSVTEVYRNAGSNHFTRLNLGLEAVAQGSVAWVDYDNDGRLDIFETGYDTSTSNWVAQLYHNNGDGTFTLAVTNLPVLPNARGYWGDYDNDGLSDLLLAGSGTTYLLHNDGAGNFSNSGLSIPAHNSVIAPWGDYDGDGRLDFITSPTTVSVVYGPDYHPTFYHNEGNGAFSTHLDYSLDMWLFSAKWGDIDNSGRACLVVSGWVPLVPGGGIWSSGTKVYIYLGTSWQEVFTLGGWDSFSETWVDYNAGGALDIFTTGGGLTTFWNNDVALHRDFPQPPLSPNVAFTGLDGVTFSWQSPSNTPPTGRGLSYNVRVGHAPGGVDVLSPLADPATGRRFIPALGNAGAAHLFVLTNLPPGNYYWAVQSIGQSYTGSPFTADGLFTVTSSPPIIVTQPTNSSVLSDSNAVFAASVIGTKPLAFQWRKDGVPLSDNATFFGSASPVLVVSNCQPNLDGAYDLIITNNYGSVTSGVAVLYVHGEPRMLAQPSSIYVLPGGSAGFTASAAGTAPLNYQWCLNGAPLTDDGHFTGTATPALSIQNIATNDAGAYQLVVTNAWGAITSSIANLSIATARYVNVNNPSPAAPYTSWATAATVIQNAIDAANVGDWILVSNGVYVAGGRLVGANDQKYNRVVMTNQVTVLAVNGPRVTSILGDVSPGIHTYGTRCVWLGSGSTLSGFTVASGGNYYGLYSQNGYDIDGGGIRGESRSAVVTDCIITGNSGCWYGGGVDNATLINCLLTGNNAWQSGQPGLGGGAYNCALINCTVVGNSGNLGSGGTAYSTCENCIVYDNPGSGASQGNYFYTSFATSCTTPDPGGAGNSTDDPVFVDYTNGDYRLQFNSPCINTGSNAFVALSTDLDGHPRIVGSSVDMGAYEYQPAPWFLTAPASQTVLAGSNFSLTVTALGDPPTFQWWLNGAPLADGGRITGSGSNSLTVSLSQTNDSGSYWVTASNSSGTATSAVATVAVVLPMVITNQPSDKAVLLTSNATFTVGVASYGTPAYQWYENGAALTNGGRISGATSARLTISGVQSNDAGPYQVIITNLYAAATSAVANLIVYAPAQITAQPQSVAAWPGNSAAFAVTVTGTAISYQWYFNGAPLADSARISGSTGPTLNISSIQSSDAGGYVCLVSNVLSTATSRQASLTVLTALTNSVRYVYLSNANPVAPYLDWTTAATNIQDAVDAAVPGDFVLVSNGVYKVGTRTMYAMPNRVVVDKAITVQSANGPGLTRIEGGSNPAASKGNLRCVYLTNGAALLGFTLTNGSTAGGDVILAQSGAGAWCESSTAVISNCVFVNNFAGQYGGGAFGGTLLNCILSNNTAAFGGGGASNTLLGCTLTKNFANYQNITSGGGAFYSVLTNCLLVANGCYGGGGGAFGGTLAGCILSNNTASSGGALCLGHAYNSLISSNAASSNGGGAYSNVLINCVLKNNAAARGLAGGAYTSFVVNSTVVSNTCAGSVGGLWGCYVTNSIIYFNKSVNESDSRSLVFCCSYPSGSVTNDPLFVNLAAGDYHLQPTSPCINSGNNAFVQTATDFDGNPRIIATVDLGAYEFQPLGRDAFNAWLEQFGFPTDGSAIYADPDHDGLNNLQEWIAGTSPTNAASVLRLLSVTPGPTGINLVWQSVSNRAYFLERSADLTAQPPFAPLAANIPGVDGTTTYTDTTATGPGAYYYRVGVQIDSNHLYTPFSVLSYAWLQKYGLPTDGTVDFSDTDADGMNNWQEWIAGTNPTNAASFLGMNHPVVTVTNTLVSWQSVTGKVYFVQRSTNLAAQPPFLTLQTHIPAAQSGMTSFSDTNVLSPGPAFYRVGVQP